MPNSKNRELSEIKRLENTVANCNTKKCRTNFEKPSRQVHSLKRVELTRNIKTVTLRVIDYFTTFSHSLLCHQLKYVDYLLINSTFAARVCNLVKGVESRNASTFRVYRFQHYTILVNLYTRRIFNLVIFVSLRPYFFA